MKNPGGGRKKNRKITGGGKNFVENPGDERKKRTMENSRGLVKVLIEFQRLQFLKMDIFNKGYGLFLEKPIRKRLVYDQKMSTNQRCP